MTLFEKLDCFGKMEEGWDGYYGVAASIECVERAKNFIKNLPNEYKLPEATLGSTGTVELGWYTPDDYVTVITWFKPTKTLLLIDDEDVIKQEIIDVNELPFILNLFLSKYFKVNNE